MKDVELLEGLPISAKAPSDSVTIIETVYHSRHGHSPTAVDCRFMEALKESARPYVREYCLGNTPTKLETGWLSVVGNLVLHNKTQLRQVRPSAEEALADLLRVVDVLVDGVVFCQIPYGQSQRLSRPNVGRLALLAPLGADCEVTAFPA